jgi:hypothetical protein
MCFPEKPKTPEFKTPAPPPPPAPEPEKAQDAPILDTDDNRKIRRGTGFSKLIISRQGAGVNIPR